MNTPYRERNTTTETRPLRYGDFRIVRWGSTSFFIEEWKRAWWKLWLGGEWVLVITRADLESALETITHLKEQRVSQVVWTETQE